MQRVAGILGADQVRERHGDALGRREAVFAVENHAVAAIEQQHGSAGALVIALVHAQVGIVQLEGQPGPIAAHGVEEGGPDVQVDGVAEFIGLGGCRGFYASGQVARVMPPQAALSQRAHQVFERAEAQKIDGLVRDFKTHARLLVTACAPARGSLTRLRHHGRLLGNEAFLGQALGQAVQESFQFFPPLGIVH